MEFIKIHPRDTVAVALCDLREGTVCRIADTEIVLQEDILQGHKFSLKDMKTGENIIKYGNPIGHAKNEIKQGTWVHVHNMQTNLGDILEYKYEKTDTTLAGIKTKTFSGYRRANGKAAIRNEIWIIPTVGCVNNIVNNMEKRAASLVGGSLEEVVAFNHPYGCSQMGDDQENTRKILADIVNHPNAGGVLLVGLGCENSNIQEIKKYLGDYDKNRVRFLVAQECEDELEEARKILEELAAIVKKDQREEIPVSELVIGMKCGGSDGLSGITANPAVGLFSDYMIAQGATTILTEVPEMFGAETLLMNRCRNQEIFEKTVKLINDFKEYFTSHNQTIYENPSPGNKQGGISTLEDKSQGCTQKSGTAEVVDVLAYGECVRQKGLNLLSAPGNDLVASTALAASGAHLVLFTTGRGTPFASPVPTVKIASNTKLANRKRSWIDFDCGTVAEDLSLEECAKNLLEYVIAVASGKKVKAEENGYHDLAIFKQGVTL